MKIKLTPKPNALQRTKNRIREHGPVFLHVEDRRSVVCCEGAPGILVETVEDPEWLGWIPADEVTIEEI